MRPSERLYGSSDSLNPTEHGSSPHWCTLLRNRLTIARSGLVKVISAFVRREYISRDGVARATGSVFRRSVGMTECPICRQQHVAEISRLIAQDVPPGGDVLCERAH